MWEATWPGPAPLTIPSPAPSPYQTRAVAAGISWIQEDLVIFAIPPMKTAGVTCGAAADVLGWVGTGGWGTQAGPTRHISSLGSKQTMPSRHGKERSRKDIAFY